MGFARTSCVCLLILVGTGCPASPPQVPLADARVVFVDGNVVITQAGAPVAARVDLDLDADDRIAPAAGARIVIALKNGHLVRLDDAGTLAVREILLFGASPTDTEPAVQLNALLDPGESVAAGASERAAAWRSMRRVAQTATRQEEKQKEQSVAVAEPRAEAPARAAGGLAAVEGGGGRADIAELVPEKAKENKNTTPTKKDAGAAQPAARTIGDEAAPLFASGFGRTPAAATAAALPAAIEAHLPAVQTCLTTAARAVGLTDAVDLLVEVRGGKVVRVRIRGGLAATCAHELLTESANDATDGWFVITIPPSPAQR
jgi:hypothetical protein